MGFFCFMNNLAITILARHHEEWVMLVRGFGEVSFAEDIVQETYIKIINSEAIGKVVVNGLVNRSFMYVALKNNFISYMRSKGKISKVEINDELLDEEYNSFHEGSSIERHIAIDIVEDEIQDEIQSWHWYDRDMFLHYIESGKSQRRISKDSTISLSSISNTIVNCKDRIRQRVGEDIEDIYNREYNLVIMSRKKKKKKPQGLGDIVEQITTATGIKKVVHWIAGEDCGCEERKEKLNKAFPLRKTPNCLLESDYEWCQKWFNSGKERMKPTEQLEFLSIYNRVFNTAYTETNCGSCLVSKLNELKKIYKTYETENVQG